MASIKIDKNGKVKNPIAKKLLIVGATVIEINLVRPEIVTEKKSFCIVTLAENYVSNSSSLGSVDEYIKHLSKGYFHIDIETDKGKILGLNLTPYYLKQLKNAILGLIVINKIRNDEPIL